MRPITEQVILVTGSTDGIGKLTARELARMGATVLLHGRSREKGDRTLRELRDATGNAGLRFYEADFSSLAAVGRLARMVSADYPRLDVLVNNAGIGSGRRGGPRRELSRDGHELRFAVNYLAPFLLTHLLLPSLRRGAPARIVNVASAAQSPIDFDDVMLERRYDGMQAYAQSKLALVMFTIELAGRLDAREVCVNALHPGSLLDTRMVREDWGRPWGPAEQGAEAEVYLATAPELEGVTGRYFDGTREARAAAQAYDPEARRRLVALSEALTGLDTAGQAR